MLKRLVLPAVFAAVPFALCRWLVVADYSVINSIVWNLMGVLSGVMIGAVVYLVSVIEGIKRRAIRDIQRHRDLKPAAKDYLEGLFDTAMCEVKQDTGFLIAATAVMLLLVLWGHIDLPLISWPRWSPLTKIQCIYGTVWASLNLSLYAVWDAVGVMFGLSDLSDKIDDGGAKPPDHNPAG